jgi:hypothetical protein
MNPDNRPLGRGTNKHAAGGLLWLGEDTSLSIGTLRLLKKKVPEDYQETSAVVYGMINRQTKAQYKETLKELRKVFDDPPV